MAKKTLAAAPSLTAEPAPGTWHGATAGAAGAGGPSEAELRLIGPVQGGRRLLHLGCGPGQASVALARRGAKVIAVDARSDHLDATRELAEEEGLRIELHQTDLAGLAFLRADTVDVAFSAFALAAVPDLNRVFRQVHRVLRPEAPFVFSLPHPAFTMLDPCAADPLRIVRAYDDPTPMTVPGGAAESRADDAPDHLQHPHTIGAVFTGLTRANFKVDALVEPTASRSSDRDARFADVMRHVPPAVLFRARKQGN